MAFDIRETPVKVDFGADNNALLEKHVLENIEDLKRSHKQLFEQEYPDMRRKYEGIPKNSRVDFPWKDASNLVIQLIATYADQLLARVMGGIWEMSPLWPIGLEGEWEVGERGEEQRQITEEFLTAMGMSQEELALYKVEYSLFHDAIKYGFQVAKHPWEVVEEEIVLGYEEKKKTPTSKIETIYEGPRPEKIPLNKFLIPPDAKNLRDCFKAHILTLHKFDIEKRVFQKVWDKDAADEVLKHPDRNGPLQADKEEMMKTGVNPGQAPSTAQEWDIYECWFPYIHNDKMYRLIYTYHLGTKKCLRKVFNFYPNNDEPFTGARLGYEGDTIRGRGFCKILDPYQSSISTTHNQGINAGTLANTSIYRVDPSSKLDASFSIYPSACVVARDGEFEVHQMGREAASTIERDKLTLELAQQRAGVAPPTSGSGGGVTNPKKGNFSAMGTFSVQQEGNRRTNINVTDFRYCHIRLGMQALKYYGFFGIGEKRLRVYGKRADDLKRAMENIKSGRLAMPVKAATASINREIEKQNDMLMINIARGHYQWVGSMLQTVSQAPPDMQEYVVNTIVASDLLMRHILRNFGHDDASRFIPQSALVDKLIKQIGERNKQSGGESGTGANGGTVSSSAAPNVGEESLQQTSLIPQAAGNGMAQGGGVPAPVSSVSGGH